MYLYYCNAILTTGMNNKRKKGIIWVFKQLTTYLIMHGINPGFQFIDNEASISFKMAIPIMDINYQLVLPGNYRAKDAEISIQNFKKHFVAGLCRVEKYSHLQFWDVLLQQATISLNILRKSRIHPHLSSYTHIFGEFDYNRTPFARPGTRIVIHHRPNYRASWAPHG